MERQTALALLTAPGEPFELESAEVYGRRCRAFVHAPPTLRDLYREARSELPFIVYEDECITFAQAWNRAAQIADFLRRECGVRKGDRVAISMRNYPEWILCFMATTSIGCVAVALNSFWGPEEMAYGLRDSGARVLFADGERLARLAQCGVPEGLVVVSARAQSDFGTGARSLIKALERVPAATPMPAAKLGPGDDAIILYTSGSTGHPKGALSCHRNITNALLSWELDAAAAAMRADMQIEPPEGQPAILLGVPLFHATGSHAVLLTCFRAQRRVVCMYKWDVAEAATLIERHRINAFTATPAMTGDLVAFARAAGKDLSSLQNIGGGGAHRAPEQVRGIDETFANARPGTGWGMTETNAIGTVIGGDDYLYRPASSGRCSAVIDLRIVDDGGRSLPAGERGEVQIRGTTVFGGYWKRPDATAEAFDGDWLKTGDVGYLDEEGFLFIVDRIKDLVIRGGENIGCGAVESALLEHPHVLEACVYAVPDERLGEEVGATVYVRQSLDEEELCGFLEPRLARFEIPRYFEFRGDPLPRTGSGKIFKRHIREAAAAVFAQGSHQQRTTVASTPGSGSGSGSTDAITDAKQQAQSNKGAES